MAETASPSSPTERLSRRVQALSHAALRIQEATTPDEVLDEVGRQLQAIGLAWHESLLSESGTELVIGRHSLPAPITVAVERLLGIRIAGFRVPVDRVAVLRQLMQDRQAVYTPGAAVVRDTLPWAPPAVLDRLVRLIGAQHLIVAPLLTRGQLHGALTVWSNELSPDDLPAVVIFAQQVATAFDNARLLAETQRERVRLEAILEQMPGGVVIAEAPSGRVVRTNAQVERLLGHPTFPASTVADYQQLRGFHREGRPYAADEWPLARSIRNGEVVRGEEVDYQRPDGTHTILSMNAAPIRDANGTIVAGVVTFYDVTDNARLYRDAQDAIQARDEFLSVAAHELKTPLTSLIGFAQLASRQFERVAEGDHLDAPRLQQALKAIHRQSITMSRLVSQLLDLSRIEAGRLSLALAPADVTALVELAVEATRVRQTGHRIVVDAPGPLLGQVDALRVEQVLTNLLDNAVKYSPANGQIDVSVAPVAGGLVEIRVRDRGIGIAPEHRHRIFDRFFQAHQADHLSGMGIGLYVSRQIMELHGGQLNMESPDDGGTAFVVRLPLGQATLERV